VGGRWSCEVSGTVGRARPAPWVDVANVAHGGTGALLRRLNVTIV